MAVPRLRVPIAVAWFLIILGLPAAGMTLSIGLPHLFNGNPADFLPAVVLSGLGVFLLLMAIAALRGLWDQRRQEGENR